MGRAWGRVAVCVAAAVVASACGEEDQNPSAGSATDVVVATTHTSAPAPPTTTPALAEPQPLVIETRPATPVEMERFDQQNPLDCPYAGAEIWDYAEVTPEELGRVSQDALLDAIGQAATGLGPSGADYMPSNGWTELTTADGTTYFVDDLSEWRALVKVGGDPTLGVWRVFTVVTCQPEGYQPEVTNPPTTPVRVPPVTTGVPPDVNGYTVDGPIVIAPPCASVATAGCEQPMALLEGTLVIEGDCLYVEAVDSGGLFSVLWPYGTAWDPANNAVFMSNGVSVAVGDQVALGGGATNDELTTAMFGAGPPEFLHECANAVNTSPWLGFPHPL